MSNIEGNRRQYRISNTECPMSKCGLSFGVGHSVFDIRYSVSGQENPRRAVAERRRRPDNQPQNSPMRPL
jgi:hypothetical protein